MWGVKRRVKGVKRRASGVGCRCHLTLDARLAAEDLHSEQRTDHVPAGTHFRFEQGKVSQVSIGKWVQVLIGKPISGFSRETYFRFQ